MAADDANFDETYGRDPASVGPDEVGSHPATMSPFGVFDMSGNASEWVQTGPGSSEIIARSGGYFIGTMGIRTTTRFPLSPTFRDGHSGIRVCATVPQ